MYVVVANIEILGLGNNRWPDWNNICSANTSGQPDHPWLKPTSSSQSISMDSDSLPEDEDGDGDDVDGGAEAEAQPTAMTSKGKETAPVGTDDNDNDNEKTRLSTTPKGKQHQVNAVLTPGKSALKKTSSQPLRVGPPGPGKIKATEATMSSRGEGGPGPSRGDRKGKGKAIVDESTDESRPQKPILPLSGDRPGKGKAKAQQLATTSGGRAEGHLGPSSGGDRKGKVKAVTEESADERRLSKPLPPSTDRPGKAKSKAQANMADYILPVKGKGKEKAIGTKDGVLEKGR